MPIYEITQSAIRKLGETTFSAAGIRERADLQRLLRSSIDVISPDTLVVADVVHDDARGAAYVFVRQGSTFVQQSDGNGVVYAPGSRPVWNSGTAGLPSAYLIMQDDGNLVVYTPGGRPGWNSFAAR